MSTSRHAGAVLPLAAYLALLALLAPREATAQSDFDLDAVARGELDVANATLRNWHDQLHVEADALQLTLHGPELAGPAATLILGGLGGLTGAITAVTSLEGPGAALHLSFVILGVAGGLLVFGIGWLIERVASRYDSEPGRRYRAIGRALVRVHREMRRRPGVGRPAY